MSTNLTEIHGAIAGDEQFVKMSYSPYTPLIWKYRTHLYW